MNLKQIAHKLTWEGFKISFDSTLPKFKIIKEEIYAVQTKR